jgi:hypothetical protein
MDRLYWARCLIIKAETQHKAARVLAGANHHRHAARIRIINVNKFLSNGKHH